MATKYQQIVWLSSYPKSGNTWARCFFDAYFSGSVDINALLTTVGDDIAARCLPGDGTEPHKLPVDIQVLLRGMGLYRLVNQYNQSKIDGLPLIVKTHNAHMLCNGVELLSGCLTKSVIHIVRDPRDVLLSFAKHMGKPIDEMIDLFCDRLRVIHDKRNPKMSDFISSWSAHVASFANSDTHNVKIFKYEDMKSDPVKQFYNMLVHAGIQPDIERVQKAVDLVALDQLKRQEAKDGFTESSPFAKNQFFGDGATGGWNGKLSQSQVFKIEKACRSMMKRFDYPFETKAVA